MTAGRPVPSVFMPVQTTIEKITNAQDVIRGVKKHFAKAKVVSVWGKSYAPAEIVAFYEGQLAAIEGVRLAYIAWQEALDVERKLRKPAIAMTRGLKNVVWSQRGVNAFGDFGWPRPKKPGPKTIKSKLAGVEKRRKK
jgi:hypothetical protein